MSEAETLAPECGRFAAGRHLLAVRVYYEDTDFSGIVYHANYLRFMERGRTETLRALGLHQARIHAEDAGYFFVVAHMDVAFRKPAKMDDELIVETTVKKISAARLEMHQIVRRGGETLVEALVTVAALCAGKPIRLPAQVREKLAFLAER